MSEEFAGTERYRILSRLGAGGMGVVYEVWDEERGDRVALKTLTRANPSGIYRFKREFRSLAEMSHPNLVALHELVAEGEEWFFTMELVEGTNFLSFVRGGANPMSAATVEVTPSESDPRGGVVGGSHDRELGAMIHEDRLRHALLELAQGLSALHAADKAHRDIKPSNVLVSESGHVTIVDFGLVVESAPEGGRSVEESLLGTPAYMSPEQAAGDEAGPPSDWYSMGVVLYEALTGILPFSGSLIEVVTSKQLRDPAPPGRFVDGVPEDLESLCVDLLNRDPAERPDGEEVIARLEGRRPPSQRPPRPDPDKRPLVGRSAHLAILENAFSRLREGHPITAHVRGHSGHGKSALLAHFARGLRRRNEATVLSGRCHRREAVPFKALDTVIDALSRHLRRLDDEEVNALLPTDVHALARMFPVLERVEAVLAMPDTVGATRDAAELRRRASGALKTLLGRMAAVKPLVMVIDDAQWADVDSAILLSEVLRPPDTPPLLLLAAWRLDEEWASGLVEIVRDTRVEQTMLTVARLSEDEALELATTLLTSAGHDPLLADRIAVESEGVPFFVEELVRMAATRSAAPVSLGEALRERLDSLDPDASRLLEVISLAGVPVAAQVAAQASQLGAASARAVVALTSNHLIQTRSRGGREILETYHDRIRETVVAGLAEEQARLVHGHLAAALLEDGEADPEAVAMHLEAAGDVGRAQRFSRDAADRAASTLAFDHAVSLYRRALALRAEDAPDRAELEAALGMSLANAGRGAQSAEAYLRAAALGHPEAHELRRRAAERLLQSGHVAQGLEILGTVLDEVGLSLPPTPRKALASLAYQRGRLRLAGMDFEERREADVPKEDLRRIDACWAVATGLSLVDPVRGAEFQARHLRLALESGEPYRISCGLGIEAAYLASRGVKARERVDALLARADAVAEGLGRPHAVALIEGTRATRSYLMGRWRECVGHAERAEEVFRGRCTNVTWELATTTRFRLLSLFYLGRVADLAQDMPRAMADARDRGDLFAITSLSSGSTIAAWLRSGDVEGAGQHLDEIEETWPHLGYVVQHFTLLQGRGMLDRYAGREAAAWERVTSTWTELERSLVLRVQLLRIQAWTERAMCALATGDDALLRDALQQARRLEKEDTPLSRAFALAIRAAVRVQHDEKGGGATELEAAEAAFVELEMAAYAAAARLARGRAVAGAAGEELIADAEAFLTAQGVVDPALFSRVLLPVQPLVRPADG